MAMSTSVEIFLEQQLSRVDTVCKLKFGSNNIYLKSIAETSIAEMPHSGLVCFYDCFRSFIEIKAFLTLFSSVNGNAIFYWNV